MIYVTKEDLKRVGFSLMYVFLPPKNTLDNFRAPVLYFRSPLEKWHTAISFQIVACHCSFYRRTRLIVIQYPIIMSLKHPGTQNVSPMTTDIFLLNHNVSIDPGRPFLSAFTTISSHTTTHETCLPGLKF